MRIAKLDYSEFVNTDREWQTSSCTFDQVNLIVGKNASGKSRTLNVIFSIAANLSDQKKLTFSEGHYKLGFSNGIETDYELEYHNRKVAVEKFFNSERVFLERNADSTGEIYYAEEKKKLRFQMAEDELAVVSRRDLVQHPFLEPLIQWAENLNYYRFGTALGKDRFSAASRVRNVELSKVLPKTRNTQLVVDKYIHGESEFGDKFRKLIINDMTEVGFPIQEVIYKALEGFVVDPALTEEFSLPGESVSISPIGLAIKEADLPGRTSQYEISDGMFRALSLIIQINLSLLLERPSCILIDDIGEGLDYERSSALIKLLIHKAEESSVQLIMSTNDRFVMNNVPLKYWILLERRGGLSVHHNYRNSKKEFDNFALTGLSNFDFFSSQSYLTRE